MNTITNTAHSIFTQYWKNCDRIELVNPDLKIMNFKSHSQCKNTQAKYLSIVSLIIVQDSTLQQWDLRKNN